MAYAVAGAYLARLRSLDADFAGPGTSRDPPRRVRQPVVRTTLRDVAEGLREAFTPSEGPAHKGPKPEPAGR